MNAMPGSNLRLGPEALKILAHPLRSRLLTRLRMDGSATATGLATALATNTGATSYHLRKLASVGLVEETDEGRGKERWWRAATETHSWSEGDISGDPDAEAAAAWLRHQYLRGFVDRYEAWLADEAEWSADWRVVAGGSDWALRLSPAGLAAFQTDVEVLIERHRDRAGQAPAADDPDRTDVEIQVHAFPRPRAAG